MLRGCRRAVAMAMRKGTEAEHGAKAQMVPPDDEASVGTDATDPLTDDEDSVISSECPGRMT